MYNVQRRVAPRAPRATGMPSLAARGLRRRSCATACGSAVTRGCMAEAVTSGDTAVVSTLEGPRMESGCRVVVPVLCSCLRVRLELQRHGDCILHSGHDNTVWRRKQTSRSATSQDPDVRKLKETCMSYATQIHPANAFTQQPLAPSATGGARASAPLQTWQTALAGRAGPAWPAAPCPGSLQRPRLWSPARTAPAPPAHA